MDFYFHFKHEAYITGYIHCVTSARLRFWCLVERSSFNAGICQTAMLDETRHSNWKRVTSVDSCIEALYETQNRIYQQQSHISKLVFSQIPKYHL